MPTNLTLHLTIVSQERELVSTEVVSVTAPASQGEVTILPGHIPLLSRLDPGELRYTTPDTTEHYFVVSRGFLDVAPEDQITVIVDVARDVREISVEKAQQAVQNAQKALEQSEDQHERMMAEASLRQALLEIRIAQKTHKTSL